MCHRFTVSFTIRLDCGPCLSRHRTPNINLPARLTVREETCTYLFVIDLVFVLKISRDGTWLQRIVFTRIHANSTPCRQRYWWTNVQMPVTSGTSRAPDSVNGHRCKPTDPAWPGSRVISPAWGAVTYASDGLGLVRWPRFQVREITTKVSNSSCLCRLPFLFSDTPCVCFERFQKRPNRLRSRILPT